MNLNLYMYATKLFEMCRCSINTNFQDRCDQGLSIKFSIFVLVFKNEYKGTDSGVQSLSIN